MVRVEEPINGISFRGFLKTAYEKFPLHATCYIHVFMERGPWEWYSDARELKVRKERSVNDLKGGETQVKIQGPPYTISVILYDKKKNRI